jgi:glucose/arabinose dehydrogenase
MLKFFMKSNTRLWERYILIALLIIFDIAIISWLTLFIFSPRTPSLGYRIDNDQSYNDVVKPGTRLADIAGDVEVLVENLHVPWEIASTPDNEMLVTLREGTLLHFSSDSVLLQQIDLPHIQHTLSDGLLGLALHPNFLVNNWLYLFETIRDENEKNVNRVVRYTFDKQKGLLEPVITIDDLPAAKYHNGGRLKFGPDNMLYITTGDGDDPQTAQDVKSLGGKILRIRDDGLIPDDNPFGNAVWSYGHRNAQGLAWDKEEQLWSIEHGNVAHDELNLIEKGGNYGWPIIQGEKTKRGLIAPVIESGANWTWAPPSVVFVGDTLYFSGLRGESLFEVTLINSTVSELKVHLLHDLCRLRVVHQGPDGFLYLATSNSDGQGHGTMRPGDDKIIRIKTDSL